MKNNGLRNRLNDLLRQIIEKVNPERVILFGSALEEVFTDDSDLDILIIKRDVADRGIDRQLEIDRLIDRSGVALDILVYKPEEIEKALKIGDPFIKEIMEKGEALYG